MSASVPYRLRQVGFHLSHTSDQPPTLPADAAARLTDPMLHQFRILPVADQLHLLAVYHRLAESGADDDTITAGLIHDVGKACAKCRITLLDRSLHVILPQMLPGPYEVFARRETAPAFARGLHRMANHAARGALAAEQAGYNTRIAWLVRHHESGGDPMDPGLRALRDADKAL